MDGSRGGKSHLCISALDFLVSIRPVVLLQIG
jgi:hypothetical protein